MAQNTESVDGHGSLDHIYFFTDRAEVDTDDSAAGVCGIDDGNRAIIEALLANHHRQSESRDSSIGTSSMTADSGASTTSSNMNPLATPFVPRTGEKTPSPSFLLFEIRSVPNKGLGAIATRFIPRGTEIYGEKPLIAIPRADIYLAWGSYCRLNNWQREIFDKLHGYEASTSALENVSRMQLIDYTDQSLDEEDIDELVAEQVRVMSIFSANAFGCAPNGLAVFAKIARFNHSCVANALGSFNPAQQKFTIYAAYDIQPGEEITLNYKGMMNDVTPRTQRVHMFREEYGFTCTCLACLDRTGASDGRRALIGACINGLKMWEAGERSTDDWVPDTPGKALVIAKDLITALQDEGLYNMSLAKAYRVVSRVRLMQSDWHGALFYAFTFAEIEEHLMGVLVQDIVAAGYGSRTWIQFVVHSTRKAIGKADANKLVRMVCPHYFGNGPEEYKRLTGPQWIRKRRKQQVARTHRALDRDSAAEEFDAQQQG